MPGKAHRNWLVEQSRKAEGIRPQLALGFIPVISAIKSTICQGFFEIGFWRFFPCTQNNAQCFAIVLN
jgi:hypothetical protein